MTNNDIWAATSRDFTSEVRHQSNFTREFTYMNSDINSLKKICTI